MKKPLDQAAKHRFSIDSRNLLRNAELTINHHDAGQPKVPHDWTLAVKPNWQLTTDMIAASELAQSKGLNRKFPVFRIQVNQATENGSPSYLRQVVKLEQYPDGAQLVASLKLKQFKGSAPLLVALFANAELTEKIYQRSILAESKEDWATMTLLIDLQTIVLQPPEALYVVFQIGIPDKAPTELWVSSASLKITDKASNFQPLRFCFSTFGDYTKASSRLRAWKLMNCLAEAGHSVTTNVAEECDVYVCQKVRPFEQVRYLAQQDTVIVYDFDDNYTLPTQGTEGDLITFINSVDVVTVGSDLLADFASRYHPNVFVLPNPVDILTAGVVRQPRAELAQIGWFGAPEGMAQLELVNIDEPITTVTRGGDIEFDLYQVDRTLTKFDLLLFPLEPTEWNLAKNANRMIKAVALGIPVLATATPEQSRVAAELGLSSHFLVEYGEDWGEKLAYLRQHYADVQDQILRARQQALYIYAVEKVTEDWFHRVVNSPKRIKASGIQGRRSVNPGAAATASDLSNIGVLIYNYSLDQDFSSPFRQSEVNWQDFGSKYVVNPAPYGNLAIEAQTCGFEYVCPKANYLELFGSIDRAIANMPEEWVLLVSAQYTLTYGLYAELAKHELATENQADVLLFNSQAFAEKSDLDAIHQIELAKWLWELNAPGVLLVRRHWLKQHLPHTLNLMSYWTWYVVLKALSDPQTHYRHTTAPVAIRTGPLKAQNLSSEYAKWLSAFDKQAAAELPATASQWQRITYDVVSHIMVELPESLPVAVAQGLEFLNRKDTEIDQLKKEMKRQKERIQALEKELKTKAK